MPEILIEGIPIRFPYEPYTVQIEYMRKVIQCLKQGVNGMLESPTGTGKTLSLLCASLSWLTLRKSESQGESVSAGASNSSMARNAYSAPKIIYASRTHTQLTQAIQELKKAGYGHMKVAVLGSRDQMCIHPDVSKAEGNFMKVNMCQALTRNGSCHFYMNLGMTKSDPALKSPGVMDIEDLVKVGQERGICPYFWARDLKNDADVIFMPYNYVLNEKYLKSQGVELKGSVVILDEAHNIEKLCEDSLTVHFCVNDIAKCRQEIRKHMDSLYKEDESVAESSAPPMWKKLSILNLAFLILEEEINNLPIVHKHAYPGTFMIELLERAQITQENSDCYAWLVERCLEHLSLMGTSKVTTPLENLLLLLNVLFVPNTVQHKERIKKCFKVHVSEEELKMKDMLPAHTRTLGKKKEKILYFMCFTPGFGMNRLLANNVRCIILTSGTLTPLPPLVSELSIPIAVTLENPHVIGPGQVYVSIVSNGPDEYTLNSSFATRSDKRYLSSLGNTILNVCRIAPHGVLVFFVSYSFMNKCKQEWERKGLWTKISDKKPIFVESRDKEVFANSIAEYYNKIHDPITKGACFMGVLRGKVSEGLDFKDGNGRTVIITGIPYPPGSDIYVILKKKYLEDNRDYRSPNVLTAKQWYLYEATRAVNQAIGRVIRHKDDYGAILLCDNRFHLEHDVIEALSSWVQPQIKRHKKFGSLIRDLKTFFVNAEQTLPPPRVKGPAMKMKSPSASVDTVPGHSSTSANSESAGNAATTQAESASDLCRPSTSVSAAIGTNDKAQEPLRKKLKQMTPPSQESNDDDDDAPNVRPINVLRPSAKSVGKEVDEEIHQYLSEVKSSLHPVSHIQFLRLTLAYAKSKDLAAVKEPLAEIMLGGRRNLKDLFRGFRVFVPPCERQEFEKFTAEMLAK